MSELSVLGKALDNCFDFLTACVVLLFILVRIVLGSRKVYSYAVCRYFRSFAYPFVFAFIAITLLRDYQRAFPWFLVWSMGFDLLSDAASLRDNGGGKNDAAEHLPKD